MLPSTYLKSYDGLGVAVGPLGVGVAARRVAVGVAGRLVAVGGTVVGVGVSVTSGVGVTVGVSVGVGVGVSTGVGECVDVGVKVGLGVLVGVGVAVGDAMRDIKEQPKRLTITRKVSSVAAAVPASFGAVILKPIDLLSADELSHRTLTSQSGSQDTPAFGKNPSRKSPVISALGRRETTLDYCFLWKTMPQ
jgi:hypothetical protein